MTEYGAPFDGILLGDATVAPYSAAEWARIWRLQQGAGDVFPNYGVFAGSGDSTHQPLEVDATLVASTNVEVQIGAGMIDGRFYETTAAVTLAIGANASGNPRIDTVILRLDYVAQTVRLAVKQGTPAGSPVRPTMQQDATYWEIPLADVAVANGFATIAQSVISQRQRYMRTQSMGWQAYAYPANYSFGITRGNVVTMAPTRTVLVAIGLYGNMLLQDVVIGVITGATTGYQWGWDLYTEDTNDGNTADNTIRRVAQSNGNAIGSLPGTTSTLAPLAVMGGTFPLKPGLYWLAIQNRHATDNLPLDVPSGNTFDNTIYSIPFKLTTNPNGQTLDAVTGWSALNNVTVSVVLRGRVFGMATQIVP